MSTEVLRVAFLAAAQGKLRLDKIALGYSGPAQVITATGWHDNGLPFAQTTEPFTTDVVERAKQLALDIVATHTGEASMPAPSPIMALSGVLREQLTKATARASKIGEDAVSHVTSLHSTLDTAEVVVNDVKKADAEIKAALGLSTNGGPSMHEDEPK